MEQNIDESFSFVRKSDDPLIICYKILISEYFFFTIYLNLRRI